MRCIKSFSLSLCIVFFSFLFGQAQSTGNIASSAAAPIKTESNDEKLNASFAGISETGSASLCELAKSTGLMVTEENGWELNRRYTLSIGNDEEKSVNVPYPGRELPEEAKALLETLKTGNSLHIKNIEAENIYGVAVPIPTLTIEIIQCK